MITSEIIYGILEIIESLLPIDCEILPGLVEKFEDDIIFHRLDFSCLALSASVANADFILVLVYTKDGNTMTFRMVTDCDLTGEELVAWQNRCRERFPEFKFLHHELLDGECGLSNFLHRQEDLYSKLKTRFSHAG
ncbi:MAG: hypothetical protein ABR875_03910 [Minisyncoccia bacterium]